MAWPTTTTAILFLCALGPGSAMAQDAGGSGLCFRPNLDEQRCGASLATETMYVLHGGEGGPEPELTWKLGLMANIGGRRAIGGALTLIGLHDEFSHTGVELRYRHGLGDTGAVEGALGGDWRWPSRSFSGRRAACAQNQRWTVSRFEKSSVHDGASAGTRSSRHPVSGIPARSATSLTMTTQCDPSTPSSMSTRASMFS